MQLRLKLALFTTVPILLALGLVAVTVQHQTLKLAQQERELVESAYLQSKQTELRHYVQLATSALEQIAGNGQARAAQQQQALAVLTSMKFGGDGYFFVYDKDNNVLLDARQMGQAGVDLCDPSSPQGEIPAKLIISTARNGGGIVRYDWQKPTSQQTVPKLAYVSLVPQWDWVVGTGIYLDDVQNTLQRIDQSAQENIHATRLRIYAIAAACIVLIGIAGLAVNISDHRVLSAKLRRLAQRVVRSQEDERLRVARELHDGVVQVLVSSKFLLETAQLQMQTRTVQTAAPAPAEMLNTGLTRLNEALVEIRRVSHALRPALLDDLGLAAALALLTEQVQAHSDCRMRFIVRGDPMPIPTSHSTALFRVAQEALTNAQRHANASRIDVVLKFSSDQISLLVLDNGGGFAVRKVQADRKDGIGLRNMRERIGGLGGRFTITSSRFGTRIRAVLPSAESPDSDWSPLGAPAQWAAA